MMLRLFFYLPCYLMNYRIIIGIRRFIVGHIIFIIGVLKSLRIHDSTMCAFPVLSGQ